MRTLFEAIVSFESFKPNAKYEYTLSRITEGKVISEIKQFFRDLDHLEKHKQLSVLFRGVSKDEWFRQNGLSKHFIVGEKGKYYLKENARFLYTETFDNKEMLIEEITLLVRNINTVIKERGRNGHPISGELRTDSFLKGTSQSIEDIRYYKLFLSTVLHNIGNRWAHKNESPFISMTYGEKKLEVAKKFAMPQTEGQIGMIFVYYMMLDSKHFLLTKELNNILKDLNVDWYEDLNSEMIILDGIFPHYNLGILECINEEQYNFIINPWLVQQIMDDIPLDIKGGIYVDQTDFEKLARDLGYEKFYEQYPNRSRVYKSISGRYLGRTGSFLRKEDNDSI